MPDLQRPVHRLALGDWIGRLHSEMADHPRGPELPARTPSYYLDLLRMSRVRLVTAIGGPLLGSTSLRVIQSLVTRLDAIEVEWPQIEAESSGLPGTVVHGDLVAKNLRVLPTAGRPRLDSLLRLGDRWLGRTPGRPGRCRSGRLPTWRHTASGESAPPTSTDSQTSVVCTGCWWRWSGRPPGSV